MNEMEQFENKESVWIPKANTEGDALCLGNLQTIINMKNIGQRKNRERRKSEAAPYINSKMIGRQMSRFPLPEERAGGLQGQSRRCIGIKSFKITIRSATESITDTNDIKKAHDETLSNSAFYIYRRPMLSGLYIQSATPSFF